MATNIIELRRGSWAFIELYGKELEEIDPLVRPIEYEEGRIIFEEGEPVFGVYLLSRGKVKLAKRSPDGRKQILKLVGPGEILGEEVLFHERTYSAYARALERSRTYFVTIEEFRGFLKTHPAVAIRLIEHLSQEIKGFQNKVLETSYGSSLERVSRLLLAIADRWGEEEDGGLYIGLELSRVELAELAGIASETASRLLTRLQERGILALAGSKIIILDHTRLKGLTEPLCVDLKESLL
ncbi:MAG: Crp/Fnr family transcriptional regulator [Candidatus Bipolaricaulia bacterium]